MPGHDGPSSRVLIFGAGWRVNLESGRFEYGSGYKDDLDLDHTNCFETCQSISSSSVER